MSNFAMKSSLQMVKNVLIYIQTCLKFFRKNLFQIFFKIVQNPKKINNKKGGMPMYD